MPAKADKVTIADPFLDRRTKLLPCQKEMVIWWNDHTDATQTQIAKMFKVDRRTISFIIDPQSHIENLKRRKERGGTKQYYNKEQHAASIKEHRHHKQSLLIDLNFKK